MFYSGLRAWSPVLTGCLLVCMAGVVEARGGGYAGGGGFRGGAGYAGAARSYGGGYYHGSAGMYAYHPAPTVRPPTYTPPTYRPPTVAPYGTAGYVNSAGAYRAYNNYNGYRNYNNYNVYRNYNNYTGVYGGRTGYWYNGRYWPNYAIYGAGLYAGACLPYYGGGYYAGSPYYYGYGADTSTGGAINSGNGAPTIVQGPEQTVYPAQPYPTPVVIYNATPAPLRPTPVGGVFVPVVGQSYVQVNPTTAVVAAQQVYYMDQKYYYYGGSYYKAYLEGANVGYRKVTAPEGIPEPAQDSPKSIITIATK